MSDYLDGMAKAIQDVWHAAYQEGYAQAKRDLARRLRAEVPAGAAHDRLRVVNEFVSSNSIGASR